MTETTDKKDVVPSKYRAAYKETGGGCGDFLAKKLSEIGKDGLAALHAVMKENGIATDKWGKMNPGMQRMNLANTLRASFLKGGTIKLLGKAYNAKHLAEDFQGEIEQKPSTLLKLADFLELQPNDRMVAALDKLFFSPPKKTAEERAAERKVVKDAKDRDKSDAKKVRDDKAAANKAEKAKVKAEKAAAKAKPAATA